MLRATGCLVPPGSTCLQQVKAKRERRSDERLEARGAQQATGHAMAIRGPFSRAAGGSGPNNV